MNAKHFVFASLLGAASVFAQAVKPEFEVASVRPSQASSPQAASIGMRIDGAQVRISGFTLKDYLSTAYRVKPYQIQGPDWLGTERYEMAATIPAGASTAQIPEMLQALLADRFGLKMHREKKEFPVYTLETEKGGLKLQPLAKDATDSVREGPVNIGGTGSEKGVSINLGNGSYYTFANNKFEAKKFSMETLAGMLERFLDRPIVDQTGISGNYDVTFDITPEDYQVMLIRVAVNSGVVLPPQALRMLEGGTVPSLAAAMQKAGLKLEPRKSPLDAIVVDDAKKTPTEN